MAVWLYDCTVVQLYGCGDVWLCGRADEGLYGCMAVRLATPIVFKVSDKTSLKSHKTFLFIINDASDKLARAVVTRRAFQLILIFTG